MPGIGFYQRAKPMLQILRGDNPNDPDHLSESAPVKSGETILSGMCISLELVSGDWQWVKGWVAGRVPHFARQDGATPDSLEADKLTGLSSMGQFRLRTGYYKTGDLSPLAWTAGTAIKPDGTTGNITLSDGTAGNAVCGRLTSAMNGILNIGPTTVNGVWVGGENTEALDSNVVEFDTGWNPQAA